MPWKTHPPSVSPPSLRVGILGGGQLAQMMIEEQARAGVSVHPWVASPQEPAALRTLARFEAGAPTSETLREYCGQLDVVAFENEFIDVNALNGAPPATRFVPVLECLGRLRDKLRQKRILERLGIPTAPFEAADAAHSAETALSVFSADFAEEHGRDGILKWSLYGYDGKGTFFLNAEPGNRTRALEFMQKARRRGTEVFIEKRIRFSHEAALVSVADARHRCVFYPLVISEQRGGVCHRVLGPALKLGLDSELERQAQLAAQKLALDARIVGTFAIEFFVTKNFRGEPELLVNEIAPRVHNSGHYSQDAADESQFLNHLKAVTGQEIRTPQCRNYFGMLNLLGPDELGYTRGDIQLPPSLLPEDARIRLHWYGKTEVKAGRKLGHLNFWAEDATEFEEITRRSEVEQQKIYAFLAEESKGVLS